MGLDAMILALAGTLCLRDIYRDMMYKLQKVPHRSSQALCARIEHNHSLKLSPSIIILAMSELQGRGRHCH